MGGFWDQLGPGIGTLLLIVTTLDKILPDTITYSINRFLTKLMNLISPYIEITFHEFPSYSHTRSKAYSSIETYLGTNFSLRAERLKGSIHHGTRRVALSMDDDEEITDVYKGVKVRWMRSRSFPRSNVISVYGRDEEKRAYVLAFNKRHRDLIICSYLDHVMSEGKAIEKMSRRQRLYMNVGRDDDWRDDKKMMWSCVPFEHPATFDTLAMDPKKKKDIVDDLIAFTKGKEYYARIGKPWKRGYLLYGPPGTGKSTMIAAMANFLHYDVYDLELTAVKDNTELRKLLIEISKRAIVVIEDIDCSLDITSKRKQQYTDHEQDKENEEKDLKKVLEKKLAAKEDDDDDDDDKDKEKDSKVTLSGLLNFIDGLWSACGGERIIIFTTNYVDKLDPALVRRGRMDKHIEMSYCCFESFKVLAKNYMKLEWHDSFEKIKCLLQETDISTADVAENLMPKSSEMSVEDCLENLIAALEHKANEEAKKRRQCPKEFGGKLDIEDKRKEGKQRKLVRFLKKMRLKHVL